MKIIRWLLRLFVKMMSNSEREDLAERIITEIISGFKKHPNLEEISIIPMPKKEQNTSPIIIAEKCLGIESWSIKYAFQYSYAKVLKLHLSAKTSPVINNYLKVCLIFNAEVITFWNIRRQLYLNKYLTLNDELHFSKLLLTIHPKSSQTLSYRRWLFEQNSFKRDATIHEELVICSKIAEKVANNYHAWEHRLWVFKKLNYIECFIISEFNFMTQWTQRHVSEYSGFNYYSILLKYMLTLPMFDLSWFPIIKEVPRNVYFAEKYLEHGRNNKSKRLRDYFELPICVYDSKLFLKRYYLLVNCLYLNLELLHRYSNHETLWNNRRTIFLEFVQFLISYYVKNMPYERFIRLKPIIDHKWIKEMSANLRMLKVYQNLIEFEIKLESVTDNDPIYIKNHIKWINKFFHI